MKPFSALIICNASVPYDVIPNSLPSSRHLSHKASPFALGVAISKDNSPENEILKTLTSKFPSLPSMKSKG